MAAEMFHMLQQDQLNSVGARHQSISQQKTAQGGGILEMPEAEGEANAFGVEPIDLRRQSSGSNHRSFSNNHNNILASEAQFERRQSGSQRGRRHVQQPTTAPIPEEASVSGRRNTPQTWQEPVAAPANSDEVAGMTLSDYLGARDAVSTPVEEFHAPGRPLNDNGADVFVVNHPDSPGPSQRGLQEDEPLMKSLVRADSADAIDGKALFEDLAKSDEESSGDIKVSGGSDSKKQLRFNSFQLKAARVNRGRLKFQKAVRKVVLTNKFAGNAGYIPTRTATNFGNEDFHDDVTGGGYVNPFVKAAKSLSILINIPRMLQAIDRSVPVVNPNSRKRRYWDFLILIMVIYNAVAVPLDAGFGYEKANWVEYMEITIDILFFVDIVYNFRTAYVDAQGNMIRDGKKIASAYLTRWFAIDVLASIPFEWVALVLGINVSEQVTLLAFLKTPRLLRLGRLLRFFERMKNANVFRIVRLMATMCLISHWIACIWHFLYVNFGGQPWIFTEYTYMEAPPSSFLVAFYSSFVLMMGDNVNPQNDMEYIFCCTVLVVGACFMATVVGNMALLVSNMNVTAARHRTKMDMVSDAVRYLGMPDQIQERVQEYFDYLATFSHPGPDGMHVLSELPTSLYEDICALLHVRAVRNVPPFKNCEEPFIMQLVTRLHPAVYMPGETIFRGGDVGHEMYLISKGKVAVINVSEEMVAILKEGMYFGELALLATARRVATCASLTHCDLNVLNSNDLQLTMKDFPVSAGQVRDWAFSRLAELNPALLQQSQEKSNRASAPPAEYKPPVKAKSRRRVSEREPERRRQSSTDGAHDDDRLPESANTTLTHLPIENGNRMESMLQMLMEKMVNMERQLNDVEDHVLNADNKNQGLLGDLGLRGGKSTHILEDEPAEDGMSGHLAKSRSIGRTTWTGNAKSMFNMESLNLEK